MLLACGDCGTIQRSPDGRAGFGLRCCRCDGTLARRNPNGRDTALALSLATLFLLFPANLLTLLHFSVAGIDRSSRLGSGVAWMWAEGWPLLAVIVALQAVVLPFLRFGLLSAVLLTLRFGRGAPPNWTGPAFRWAERLDVWAMVDVFLIGAGIGYGRVASRMPVEIGPGGWALIAVAFLTLLTRASLDRRAIWQAIGTPSPGGAGDIACQECQLVLPRSAAGRPCPRCRARVHPRRPGSLTVATALVGAGYLLYLPANWLPLSVNVQFGQEQTHTIIRGVQELVSAGFWPIGLIVFTASIGILLLKLIGLTWLIWSARHGSTRRLVLRTRLYRGIAEIGRWSNVDVYTIAVFLPLMQFQSIVAVRAAAGAPAFLAVVVLTMFAARAFDPRLMWDAARS